MKLYRSVYIQMIQFDCIAELCEDYAWKNAMPSQGKQFFFLFSFFPPLKPDLLLNLAKRG